MVGAKLMRSCAYQRAHQNTVGSSRAPLQPVVLVRAVKRHTTRRKNDVAGRFHHFRSRFVKNQMAASIIGPTSQEYLAAHARGMRRFSSADGFAVVVPVDSESVGNGRWRPRRQLKEFEQAVLRDERCTGV